MKPGREESRIGRTKSAKIHPLLERGLPALLRSRRAAVLLRTVPAGSLGSRADPWLMRWPRGRLSYREHLCSANEQAGSCLQDCCSECIAAGGLWWCLVGKMTKTLQLCIAGWEIWLFEGHPSNYIWLSPRKDSICYLVAWIYMGDIEGSALSRST